MRERLILDNKGNNNQITAVMAYHSPGWMLEMMALFTDFRRGELLALHWENIDCKSGTITICKTIRLHHRKTRIGGPHQNHRRYAIHSSLAP